MTSDMVTYSAVVPSQPTDYTTTISLPKFNPALGTLTEVDFSFDTNTSIVGSLTNSSAEPESFKFTESVDLALTDPLLTTLLDPTVMESQTYTNLGAGQSAAFGPFTPAQSSSDVYTSGATFDEFGMGPGNLNLTVTSTTDLTTTGGGGNIHTTISTNSGGTATVTYTYTPFPVTLAGNVYDDANGSGAIAPGDPPIPGVALTLLDSTGTTVATTTTGATGSYDFTTTTAGDPIPPGTYTIAESQPSGYLQGSNTVGTVNGVTDGELTGVDLIGSIVLTSGQSSVGNNFGELLPVSLSGSVFDDVTGNGVLAPGDLPIAGVTLDLLSSTGSIVATTVTDANGNYTFSTTTAGVALPPATYSIAELQPSGYLQGSNTVGTVNGVTDGELTGVDLIGSIVLTSGQSSVSNNFGELLPVSLSGSVFDDVTGNGVLAPGDLPIAGVTLDLLSSTGSIVATTVTDANGNYTFSTTTAGVALPPATYSIAELQPSGYLQGSNTVGTVNGVTDGELTGVDLIGSIVLTSGQSSVSNNFGELLPVSLSGSVFDDVTGNGVLAPGDLPIAGVTLDLLSSTGSIVATTVTDANGNYTFSTTTAGVALPPATYSIAEVQPSGYLQGSNTVGTVNGVTNGMLTGVDVIGSIVLYSSQSSVGNNFGEVLPVSPVSIAGNVYVDAAGTGSLAAGDPPISGVVVYLLDPAGILTSTTTNASGAYSFTTNASGAPLPPDTYTIVEFQPSGYAQGTDTVGTVNGKTVGVLQYQDIIGSIALTSGQSSVGNNFGEVLVTPVVPLTVTNVQRFGVHSEPTLIVLTFNTPLDPATAEDVGNYRIVGPTDSKAPAVIQVESASYDAATQTVTLRLAQRLDLYHPYKLSVSGLESSSGGLLVGSNGEPGGTYQAVINRSDLSGFTDRYGNFVPINHGMLYPAATAAAYKGAKFVAPANLGPFAAVDQTAYDAAISSGSGLGTLADPLPTSRKVVSIKVKSR